MLNRETLLRNGNIFRVLECFADKYYAVIENFAKRHLTNETLFPGLDSIKNVFYSLKCKITIEKLEETGKALIKLL